MSTSMKILSQHIVTTTWVLRTVLQSGRTLLHQIGGKLKQSGKVLWIIMHIVTCVMICIGNAKVMGWL